jgi:hypothetical protein
LGREDHVVVWLKPAKPAWMDQARYDDLPKELRVRELRVRVTRRGFRTQVFVGVTTLLDAVGFSAQDVADLYRARWLRIPRESCHRFHAKAATDSTASLPLIPRESCH